MFTWIARLRFLVLVFCQYIVFQPPVVFAQGPEFGKGLILASPEELKDLPKAPTYRGDLPERYDLSEFMPAPDNRGQGKQGSCVAWAVTYTRAYYAKTTEQRDIKDRSNIPSPAFVYNSLLKNPGHCRDGTSTLSALALLWNTGSVSLRDMPYDQNFCERPTQEQISKATDFRIDGWELVDYKKVDDIKGQIFNRKNPVILGLRVTEGFEYPPYPGAVYSKPTSCTDSDNCWHAIVAVGYDDVKQAFKLLNSWGTAWGDHGFGWISYDLFKTGEVGEAYAMRATPKPPMVGPFISSFRAKTPKVEKGQEDIIEWSVAGAYSIRIDNGIGRVAGNSFTVRPSVTTTYTLTAENGFGATSASVTIEVADDPPAPLEGKPVISSFVASPQSISRGQSSTLIWSAIDTTSFVIDPEVGPLKGNSVVVVPNTTTTYRLSARNPAGSTSSTVTVRVREPQEVVLPRLDCGRIALTPRNNKNVVEGYVGDDKDIARIEAMLPDADISVQLRPWPQCEALDTLQRALSLPDRPRVAIRRNTGAGFKAGDPLVFDVQTPSFPSYVHIAYIQADGSVINLIQPGDGAYKAYPPNSKITIGDSSGGGRRFFVKEPFGREMLIVLVGHSPTFPERRPRLETEREFLSALRKASLAKSDLKAEDRYIAAAYDAIVTRAQ
jgi:hypothetical protein